MPMIPTKTPMDVRNMLFVVPALDFIPAFCSVANVEPRGMLPPYERD